MLRYGRGNPCAASPQMAQTTKPDARPPRPKLAADRLLAAPEFATEHTQIRQYLAWLRVESGLSGNTQAAYLRDVLELRRHTTTTHGSSQTLAALSARDLADHLAWLRSRGTADATKAHRGTRLSGSTITRHLASLRVFFRFLRERGTITSDPTDALLRPTRWRKLPEVMTVGQISRLIQSPAAAVALKPVRRGAAKQDDANSGHVAGAIDAALRQRDGVLLELLYSCGVRATEVATLRTDDIKPELGVIHVIGKGNKQRLVPIGKPALAAAQSFLASGRKVLLAGRPDPGTLLISRTARSLERVAVWQIVKRHGKATGLTAVYPHALRHSFATHLLSGGADLRAVQEMLGHSNVTTTEIYTHVDRSRLREVVGVHHPLERKRRGLPPIYPPPPTR